MKIMKNLWLYNFHQYENDRNIYTVLIIKPASSRFIVFSNCNTLRSEIFSDSFLFKFEEIVGFEVFGDIGEFEEFEEF